MNRDCVSREITREMIVGAFVLMILLGLGYFTIVLSRGPLFGAKNEMIVCFDDVRGLREGDNVVVRGVTVGRVGRTLLGRDGVEVVLRLSQPVEIRKNHRIRVVPSSVLGGTYVRIDVGDGDVVVRKKYSGETPKDLMEAAAGVVEELRHEALHLLGHIGSEMPEGERSAGAPVRA